MDMLKLTSPPGTQTDCGLALLWNKVSGERVEYQVYVDSALYTKLESTDCTVKGLESGRAYHLRVCAVTGGETISGEITVSTKPKAEVFDVTAYGASGDGEYLCTQAIQSAIDACTPGGKVLVPAGTFRSGALFLKSDMTLYLDAGAVLMGSGCTEDYPLISYRWEGRETLCYASLINTKEADNLHDITIEGDGVIHANGAALFAAEMEERRGARGRAVCIRSTERFYLRGVTVRSSPSWCIHPIYCKDVNINSIQVHTKYDENGEPYGAHNCDGIDPDSCADVNVFNCVIASQDDCIAVKSGRDADGRAVGIPSERIRVSNCVFKSGFGVALGSEMSGGIRDVLVQDCVFDNTYSFASVKAPRGRGAVIENALYENIRHVNTSLEHHDCQWFRGALYTDMFYGHETVDADTVYPVDDGTPVIRNVTFRNITVETHAGCAVFLCGLPESPLRGIRLENVTAAGKASMQSLNVQELKMENVSVNTLP